MRDTVRGDTRHVTDDIQNLTACDLSAALRGRDLSAREALTSHLDQIDKVNDSINAVVTLDADRALDSALAADERAASGAQLPLLHGLPMTHKDTFLVSGMRSTSGSPVFTDRVPEEDDLIIERLHRAGAVATGKNNVPEFGAGSHTFNEVFGTTTNPYAPALSAGGSSGGLAAALAARIQSLGEGSDMGGSLRIPGSFCNVAGFRPSYGVIPMPSPDDRQSWLGRSGPMAREVDDLVLFMAATAGPDRRVRPPAPIDGQHFAALLGSPVGDLQGVRIGWSGDFGMGVPVEPAVLDVLTSILPHLEAAGAVVEEATPDLRAAAVVFQATRAIDFAANLGEIVRRHRDLVKPEIVWNVELGWSYSAQDLIDVAAARSRLAEATDTFFDDYDLFLSPTAQVLPFDATQRFPGEVAGTPTRTYLDWMQSACIISATGLPALTLPVGFSPDGLPVGVQLAADHYADVNLLRWARVIEQHTGTAGRRPDLLTAH